MPRRPRRVALYARLSVTTEESVSIERQLESARRYAESRGWEVVLESVDDGVSATKNRPEDRQGWRSLLDSPERFDAVVVWKVDRLARRVLDFLNADLALRERGAGIVAVEDPIDMTTPQGRAFATMLAVFAEMEAEAISARVKAARRAIISSGRRAGGRPPLGYRNVPNPDGPGYVLAHDPEWIDTVREMARRVLAGDSIYSVQKWLQDSGIKPRPRSDRATEHRWSYSGVEAVVTNPILAGMIPYQGDVLRDADGLPIVDESLAILTTDERRELLAKVEAGKRPGSRPYAGKTTALLYGLARCATCRKPMHRHTAHARYLRYQCQNPDCPERAGISRPALEEHVVGEFLQVAGPLPVVHVETVEGDAAPALGDVEEAISHTLAAMAEDGADLAALTERLTNLKAARARARAEAESKPEVRTWRTGETFREAWDRLESEEDRRELLLAGIAGVYVSPGRGGRGFRPERVSIEWRS